MEPRQEAALAEEIDKLTLEGNTLLQSGQVNDALSAFEKSHTYAYSLKDTYTQRSCAFNYGAVLIACNKAQKGLTILKHALPPNNEADGPSNGDLYYNFALGYETLGKLKAAVLHFELALDEYQNESPSNYMMMADVGTRAGFLYSSLRQHLKAARAYSVATSAYRDIDDIINQCVCMCHQSSCLLKAGQSTQAVKIADDCMVKCQDCEHSDTLGKLYNELGLTYSQCNEFLKASGCFELALPLSRGAHADRKREAIILQNLGAVYNSLSEFQHSLPYHESAIKLNNELGKKSAQGQAYANLAYAFSQIDNLNKAGEYYRHALQAAKDSGDKHGEWQTLEGLGAVSFNQNQIAEASKLFQQALSVLKSSNESNSSANQRILAKLANTVDIQPGRTLDTIHSVPSGDNHITPAVDILLNSKPRPPSRQERRERRKQRNLRRLQREHTQIARGIGEYHSDTDVSIGGRKRRPNKKSYHEKTRHRRSSRKLSLCDDVDVIDTSRGSLDMADGLSESSCTSSFTSGSYYNEATDENTSQTGTHSDYNEDSQQMSELTEAMADLLQNPPDSTLERSSGAHSEEHSSQSTRINDQERPSSVTNTEVATDQHSLSDTLTPSGSDSSDDTLNSHSSHRSNRQTHVADQLMHSRTSLETPETPPTIPPFHNTYEVPSGDEPMLREKPPIHPLQDPGQVGSANFLRSDPDIKERTNANMPTNNSNNGQQRNIDTWDTEDNEPIYNTIPAMKSPEHTSVPPTAQDPAAPRASTSSDVPPPVPPLPQRNYEPMSQEEKDRLLEPFKKHRMDNTSRYGDNIELPEQPEKNKSAYCVMM